MSLAEIVQSSGWKNFIAKLYGLGASVVIIGALFKIQHWPLASLMLTIGLMTEAVIFFFSAFEPLHEEVDWSLVYPELAGIPDEEAGELPSHEAEAEVPDLLHLPNLMRCSKKQKSPLTCSRNLVLE
jgi:gliding motility-associated protein GldL